MDILVDGYGVPDVIANIPTMGASYVISVGQELANSAVSIVNKTFGTDYDIPFEHSH